MAINLNGTNIENVLFDGQQLDKVIFDGVVVWENWKPWSYSERKPSSGYSDGYHNTYNLDYTIPDVTKYKIDSISAVGYCKKSGEENLCSVGIQIYRNGAWTEVARSGSYGSESHISWVNTEGYTDITKVRASKGGLTLKSAVSLTINGKQKGAV